MPLSNIVLGIYCEAYVVVLWWDIRINIWGVVAIVTALPDFTWLSRCFKVRVPLTWVASKSFHTAQVLIQLETKAEVLACCFFFMMHRADVNVYIHRFTEPCIILPAFAFVLRT